jgi:hypothetical protein
MSEWPHATAFCASPCAICLPQMNTPQVLYGGSLQIDVKFISSKQEVYPHGKSTRYALYGGSLQIDVKFISSEQGGGVPARQLNQVGSLRGKPPNWYLIKAGGLYPHGNSTR